MPLTLDSNNNTLNLKKVDFNPFAGPKLLKAIPTTQSQLEIWLSCIIGGEDANRSYNESVSLNLIGLLNKKAMVYALEELIKRHEILRSTFSNDGKLLCIHEKFPLNLELIDISDLSLAEKEVHIKNIHKADADKAFDLQNGPLLRTYLIKISQDNHILKLSAHHLICDGWSFGIILENISKIYSAKVNNESLVLEPAIPFSLYAKEVSEYSKSGEYQATEAYWLNQYKDDVPVLNIPTDNPRPATRTFKSQRSDFQVSKELIENIKSMGAKSKASLVSTLIAAFETYLYLLTKQSTIVLGLPTAGQSATGNYELVGHCVNLLPLCSKPNGDLSFLEYLSKRRSEIMDDYDHQQFTFGTLLQKLNIARDSSRIPLVPVIFNIDMGMDTNVSFSKLKHQLSSDPRTYENFEIFLNITGTEQALMFEWSFNSHLFRASTIQRMMNEFESVLEQVVPNPQIKIEHISIQEFELINQINAWNNSTFSAYPKDKTVPELINEIAIKNPAKTAIYFKDKNLSYTDLNQQSNRLANYLAHLGVKKGDIVGLAVDRSPEMIITLLAILKTGAAYLPLDPQYPKGRIELMLEDSSAKYIIVSQTHAEHFDSQNNQLIIEEVFIKLNNHSNQCPSVHTTGNDLAYILYTSGSTGKPKGVQIEHHSLTNFLLSVQKKPGIHIEDKLLAITTISFDIAATEIYLPLISGASIILVDSNTAKDGRELLQLVQEKNISIMQATPTTWRMMLAAGWDKQLPLKIICTGEALPKDLAESLIDKGTEIWNGYGPSETTIWSSIKQLGKDENLITIGKPIDNTQIYILDENQNHVPIGTSGELYIAGEGLARGYLNRPDLTEEKFIKNPLSISHKEKMYKTGDLGYYLENGEIVCLGRIDAQVKIRGHRIELGEIEYNLVQQAGIKEAVVIAQGENPENQSLLAYIVPDENDSSGWKDRWDDLYTLGIKSEETKPLEDQNLDIAIISQYNNEKDIQEHGIEWTNEGLKRIKALNAKRILELGTGGGHLLFQLAPNLEKYVATDYSEVAINKLNEKLAVNPEKWQHVKAYNAPADDFSTISEKDFDLIFFHGVVQYFPTLDYLTKVLKSAVQSLCDGGCIHIGDSQTLGGIIMHFATEQLNLTNEQASLSEFKNIVNYRLQKEEEISIDPGFFYFLPQIIPAITAVDVQIRGGDYSNEATKCHYDIWLYVGQAAPKVIPNDVSEVWQDSYSLDWVAETLSFNPDQVIQIKAIPNQRVQKDYVLSQLMEQLNNETSVKELKQQVDKVKVSGINPTDLWQLGERLGFKTHIRWSNDGSDGKIEVVFIPAQYQNYIPEKPSELSILLEKEYFMAKKETIDLINIPEHQIQIWRNAIKNILPEYMVPNRYVALNHFPITSNGKIDRKNLPIPTQKIIVTETAEFIAPRNDTEQLIHDIWSKLLVLNPISTNSNFFELGGHSLIAVRVMLSLEKETGVRLPISLLFENSTIQKLSNIIDISIKKKEISSEEINYLSQVPPKIIRVPSIEPQKEIWVACILGEEEANKSYNISFSEHFKGNLNCGAIERSLQELVNRHQSLRSTFSVDGTEMQINSQQKLHYDYTDISDLNQEKKQSYLENHAASNADTAFDLIEGPLFKASIIKLGQEEHLLTLTFHHIICDGSSSSILMHELSILYNAYSQNLQPALTAEPLFSDYALKKQKFYQSLEYKRIENFWVDQFKEEVPILDIPTDYIRPERRTYKGDRINYHIKDEVSQKFKKVGFDHGCSSAIAIRAALEIFLYRITGQETIVSGLPIAGQLTEDKNNLVGHCVNLIPLKAKINKDLTFIDYLNERKNYIFQAYDHHDLTFSSLLNRLNITRDKSRVPLTPVLLNIQSDPYTNQFHNLSNQSSFNKKLYETFEISINVDDLPTGMSFRWDYNTGLFKAKTIEYFHQLFESILTQIIKNPNIFIKDIDLLERENSKTEIKKQEIDKNLCDLLNDSFRKYKGQTAVSFRDKSISYKDLNNKSNQLANLLISKGIKQGDRIGISLDRSIELIIAITAIIKTGAAYLPLDRTFPTERILHIINNSSPKCIISTKTTQNIAKNDSSIYLIEDLIKESEDITDIEPQFSYNENNLVFVLHTSGSTGKPKGVCMGQKAMVNLLAWQSSQSTSTIGTKTLQFSPITFDVSFQEIFSTLTSGGTLQLITDEQRLDGLSLLEHVIEENIERIFLPFVALQSMAENAVTTNTFPTYLKEVMTAGEQLKITPQIVKFFSKIPDAVLYNQYGPTEAHVVTELKLSGDPTLWPNLPSIGKPINNIEILLLDQQLKEVYDGVAGELCISGPCLANGYLNLPDITNEKFIDWSNKQKETKRIYKTGDLARLLSDGNIEYLGRIDNQVKIRGYRIELGEIEAQLNKISTIKQSAVKVQDDITGIKRLIAYFISNETKLNPPIDYVSWKNLLKKELPDYMIPFEFVELQQMPLTQSGKIDRKSLPIVTSFNQRNSSKVNKEARTVTEKFLVGLWKEVLALESISIDDDFFELGGYSILAVKIVLAIEKEYQIRLPLATLFDNPTIESLARIVTSDEREIKWDLLVPIKTTGTKIPLYVIHGLGLNVLVFEPLRKYMDSDQPIYALQGVGLNGRIKVGDMPDSIEELAKPYVAEIIEHNPEGPYALAGYSSGGRLAHEIANQLLAMKKQIASLVIIDTGVDEIDLTTNKLIKTIKKLRRELNRIKFTFNAYTRYPKKIFNYHVTEIKKRIKSEYTVRVSNKPLIQNKNRSIYDVHYSLFLNCKLSPIDVKIDLLKAREILNFSEATEDYSWKKYAKGGVSIHEIPGDHHSCFYEPNVKKLAHILQSVLNDNNKIL